MIPKPDTPDGTNYGKVTGAMWYIVVHRRGTERLRQIQAVSKSTLIAYLSSRTLLLLLLLEIQSWQSPSQH